MTKPKSMPSREGTRLLAFTGGSYNADTREAEVVITTSAPVTRWGMIEVLQISAEAVDLARVALGQVKLLDSHDSSSLEKVLGVLTDARVEGEALVGTVRFGETEEAQEAAGMVQRGEITGISCGYRVSQWQRTAYDETTDLETWTATRWELFEVSLVAIPADKFAGIRSLESTPVPAGGPEPLAPILPAAKQEHLMSEASNQHTPEAPATTETRSATAPAVDTGAALRADRARATEILQLAARHGISNEIAQKAIADGDSLDMFRSVALEEIASRQPSKMVKPGGASITVLDPGASPEMERSARVEGMIARASGKVNANLSLPMQEKAREFADLSLLDHAREVLGLSHRARPVVVYDAIVERSMLGTTDYPNLLAAVANKILLQGYQYQQPTYQSFARKRNFNDFRVHNFLRLGDFPLPQYITETGEFKNGALSESKNTGQAATAGIIVSLTRQMFVNDDLNAFADLSRLAGQRMIDWENYTAWNYILAGAGTTSCGPTLVDTGALFNNTAITTAGGHANNSTTGAAISGAAGGSLDAARQAMRQQKSLDGVPLNGANNPSILVVGPQKETEAQTVLSTALLATQTSNVNVFMGKFQLLVDAYITDKSWFLFSDPNGLTPVLSWGYVDGFEGPRFSIDTPFRQDGMSLKAVEDWGIAAIDYRGAYRNSGA